MKPLLEPAIEPVRLGIPKIIVHMMALQSERNVMGALIGACNKIQKRNILLRFSNLFPNVLQGPALNVPGGMRNHSNWYLEPLLASEIEMMLMVNVLLLLHEFRENLIWDGNLTSKKLTFYIVWKKFLRFDRNSFVNRKSFLVKFSSKWL